MSHYKIFREKLEADRRLVILRFLYEEPDYRLSISLLQDALELMGHKTSRDIIAADGVWLMHIGLIYIEHVGSVQIFCLTERGADVATGRVNVPGVKRPAPQ